MAGVVGSDSDANDSDSSAPSARPPLQSLGALRQDVGIPWVVGGAGIVAKRPRVRNPGAARLHGHGVQGPNATARAPVPQLKPTQLRLAPTSLDITRLEQTRQALSEKAASTAPLAVQAAPVPAFRNLRQIVKGSPAQGRVRGLGGVGGVQQSAGRSKGPAVLDITASSSENLFLRALLGSDVAAVLKPCAPCCHSCAPPLICVN